MGLLLLPVVAGCGENGPPAGPPLAQSQPVHGKVTFKDGTPLRGGVVTFTPEHTKTGSQVRFECAGLVDAQGNYKLGLNGDGTGAAAGKYKVTVAPRETQELPGSNVSRIAKRYQEGKDTPLTATVKEGDNVINLTLE
jgi:hypothetical protein